MNRAPRRHAVLDQQRCAPEQIRHVLHNAASRVVITELAFLPPLLAARDAAVEHVVVVDGVVAGLRTFDEVETLGADFDARATARHASGAATNSRVVGMNGVLAFGLGVCRLRRDRRADANYRMVPWLGI